MEADFHPLFRSEVLRFQDYLLPLHAIEQIVSKMRKILLSLFLLAALTIQAAGEDTDFVNVNFGTYYSEAMEAIRAKYGEPSLVEDNAVVYLDKDISGYTFSKIIFGFEKGTSGSYLNQARFFITKPTRHEAVANRDSLANQLMQNFGVTYDYEENGNKFYKGGVSPTGIGFLFTLSTARREGQWMTELRYGAFHRLR